MSAWGKVNGIKDEILFLSDVDAKFSKSIGWDQANGTRTARYAMIIDNGKVIYAEKEPGRDITVSFLKALCFVIWLTVTNRFPELSPCSQSYESQVLAMAFYLRIPMPVTGPQAQTCKKV